MCFLVLRGRAWGFKMSSGGRAAEALQYHSLACGSLEARSLAQRPHLGGLISRVIARRHGEHAQCLRLCSDTPIAQQRALCPAPAHCMQHSRTGVERLLVPTVAAHPHTDAAKIIAVGISAGDSGGIAQWDRGRAWKP